MSNGKNKELQKQPDALFDRVVSILEQARGSVVRAVNSNMVLAYWLIGREIVEALQGGEARAAYGQQVVENLSTRLTERFGKGFSITNLWYFRQFYLAYADRAPILHPPGGEFASVEKQRPAVTEFGAKDGIPSPSGRELVATGIWHPLGTGSPQEFSAQLSWSHYRALMRVENVEAPDFYEREAVAGGWDKRTLERESTLPEARDE